MNEMEKYLNQIEDLKKEEVVLKDFLDSPRQPHCNVATAYAQISLLEVECQEALEEINKQKRFSKRHTKCWLDYLDGLYARFREIRRAQDMNRAASKVLELEEALENYDATDDGWENV